MTKWLSYPEHQPTTEQLYQDFLVACISPYFVNKKGFINRAPKYKYDIVTWLGDRFADYDKQRITHFRPLPPLPEE